MAEWWEYPKAKYHANEPPRVVHSAAEEVKLDPREWFDHPDKAKEGYKPTLEEKLEHEDYLAENQPKRKPKLVYDKTLRTILSK